MLTLNVTDAAEVRIGRIDAASADLENGMVLVVRYNRRTLDVVGIDAELRSEIDITVEEVDRENGIIRGRTDDGRIIVQRLAPDANFEKGSVSASIRAIVPGARVLVVVDRANDRALVVRTRDHKREAAARHGKRHADQRRHGRLDPDDRAAPTEGPSRLSSTPTPI